MAVLSERLDNDPIIILKFVLPAHAVNDIEQVLSLVLDFKKAHPGKQVFRIIDVTQVALPFSDMMVAMASERGKDGGVNDPNVVTIFVGSHEMVRFGVGALQQQEQYGKADVKLFTSTDDAVKFARSQLK